MYLQIRTPFAGEFAVEDQNVPLGFTVGAAGRKILGVAAEQILKYLFLRVQVNGTANVAAVVLVGIPAIYDFERGDVVAKVPVYKHSQSRWRNRL